MPGAPGQTVYSAACLYGKLVAAMQNPYATRTDVHCGPGNRGTQAPDLRPNHDSH